MRQVRLASCLLSLVVSGVVFADGKAFPEIAIETQPAIPFQRAMIVFRNGVETLLVESAFDSPSATLGWVLPVPAEPTELSVGDPAELPSLAFALGPEIVNDLGGALWPTVVVVLVLGLYAAIGISQPDLRRRLKDYLTLGVILLFVSLLASLVLPSLGTAGAVAGGGVPVEVVRTQRVGNYEVSVLRPADADALSRWLGEQGFRPADAAERAVITDYIRDAWCFVAAVLRRPAEGTLTPHPIAVSFPTVEPVYPMRLTALANSTTQVDLFVVADRRAEADQFECILSDRFAVANDDVYSDADYIAGPAYCPAHVRGQGVGIGHPDTCQRLWPGCVVTRLRATLTPEQMHQDIRVGMADTTPHRLRVYSSRARWGIVGSVGLSGLAVLLIVAWIACAGRRRPARRARIAGAVTVAATVVACVAVFVALPHANTRSMGRHSPLLAEALQGRAARDVRWLVAEAKATPDDFASPEAIRKLASTQPALGESLPSALLENPVTGDPIRRERSPGNYDLRTIDGKPFLCLYGWSCRELRVALQENVSQ